MQTKSKEYGKQTTAASVVILFICNMMWCGTLHLYDFNNNSNTSSSSSCILHKTVCCGQKEFQNGAMTTTTTTTTIIEWQKFFELLTIYGGLVFGIFCVRLCVCCDFVTVAVPLCHHPIKSPLFSWGSKHRRDANAHTQTHIRIKYSI